MWAGEADIRGLTQAVADAVVEAMPEFIPEAGQSEAGQNRVTAGSEGMEGEAFAPLIGADDAHTRWAGEDVNEAAAAREYHAVLTRFTMS